MAKRSRRERREAQGKVSAGSRLQDHKRVQSQLIPPLAAIPGLNFSSWINDRLPELCWLGLLSHALGRLNALELFRSLMDRIHAAGEDAPHDLRISNLARELPKSRTIILDFICQAPLARLAVRPLLLFPDLPARDTWREIIQEEPDSNDWPILASVIAQSLDHQSEMATDLRWCRVVASAAAGKLIFPTEMTRLVKELAHYPHLGDLRRVRPMIRSIEVSFSQADGAPLTSWPTHFWSHCLSQTRCLPLPDGPLSQTSVGTTQQRIDAVHSELLKHAASTRKTTSTDARHDAVFGMALYSLALLQECIQIGRGSSISGRLALRAILETYITLAYLLKKDAADLWQSHRVFGAGQAKLALLKLEDAAQPPSALSEETLTTIANEDIWQEFLSIELGHWTKSNLRKLSEDAGVKDEYDRLYAWTSNYTHGHWGAVRDTVFSTCANPLHRLHRVPRERTRDLPDVVEDAASLVEKVLGLVDKAYPAFSARLTQEGE